MSLEDYDFKKIGLFLAGIIIFIIAASGSVGTFYYFNKFRSSQESLRSASLTGQVDIKSLLEKVGKLIKLPDNETPTVATVSDLEKLKNQPFFAKAKIGDKVLLYTQNKKAILYDPVDNLIVEVGPLVIPTPSLQQATASTSAAPVAENSPGIAGLQTKVSPSPVTLLKVALLNGSGNRDILNNFEKEIASKFPQVVITQKENSANKDYSKSVIVDLSGKNSQVVQDLAKAFNLTSSALPASEKAPSDADLLIILAPDR